MGHAAFVFVATSSCIHEPRYRVCQRSHGSHAALPRIKNKQPRKDTRQNHQKTLDLFPNQAKAYVFWNLYPCPHSSPPPTGEGAVLRQILLTAAALHMDSYETVAIFAANAFPPPVGEGQCGGSRQQLGRFGILSGCRASYGLEGILISNSRVRVGYAATHPTHETRPLRVSPCRGGGFQL